MDFKRFGQYHVRWQASTVVMMAPMYLFTSYLGWPGWAALPLVQVIGACLFYPVDGWIFDG